MAFCSSCGAPMGEGDRFCPTCGAPAANAPAAPAAAQAPQISTEAPADVQAPQFPAEAPAARKRSPWKLVAIFAAIALVVAAAVILVIKLTDKGSASGASLGQSVIDSVENLNVSVGGNRLSLHGYMDSKELQYLGRVSSGGSVSIRADLSKWQGLGVNGSVEGTMYFDSAAQRSALIAKASALGYDIDAALYVDGTELALECKSLFSGAYGLDLATLAQDWEGSFIAQAASMPRLPEETLQALASLNTQASTAQLEELVQLVEDYANLISSTAVDAGTLTENDNDTLRGLAVKSLRLELDGDGAAQVIETVLTKLSADSKLRSLIASYSEEAAQSLDELTPEDITDFAEEVRGEFGSLTIDIYLSKKTGTLVGLNIATSGGDGYPATVSLFLGESLSTTDEISLLMTEENSYGSTTNGFVYTVSENTAASYRAKLDIYDEGDVTTVANVWWDRSSGQFKLSGDEFEVSGSLFATANSFELTLNHIRMEDESMDLDLTLSCATGVSCPAAPSYRNIMKMSQEDFIAFAQEIASSDLGALLGMVTTSVAQ